MSEKMSINVEVLGINTTHNYMVPSDMNVSKMIELIVKTLSEEYPGAKASNAECHFLVQADTGNVLISSCSLRQLGISNGEQLIMI